MEIKIANRIAQMGRRVLRRLISGYSVCLCPIKRTLGFHGLSDDKNANAQVCLNRPSSLCDKKDTITFFLTSSGIELTEKLTILLRKKGI